MAGACSEWTMMGGDCVSSQGELGQCNRMDQRLHPVLKCPAATLLMADSRATAGRCARLGQQGEQGEQPGSMGRDCLLSHHSCCYPPAHSYWTSRKH